MVYGAAQKANTCQRKQRKSQCFWTCRSLRNKNILFAQWNFTILRAFLLEETNTHLLHVHRPFFFFSVDMKRGRERWKCLFLKANSFSQSWNPLVFEQNHTWSCKVPDIACVCQHTCLWASLSAFVLWFLKYYSSGSTENSFFFFFLGCRRDMKGSK